MAEFTQQGADYISRYIDSCKVGLEAMLAQEKENLSSVGEGFGCREVVEELRLLTRDRLPRLKRALDEPFMLMVVGEGNAGKSTLINSLLGQEVVTTGLTPETKDIIYIKYGTDSVAVVHWKNGKKDEFTDREAAWKLIRSLPESGSARSHDKVDFVEIHVEREILKSVSIVDTPGMNAIFSEHEERTKKFLQDANACLWVFETIGGGGGEFSEQALAEIKQYRRRVIAVLNRVDAIDSEQDLKRIMSYTSENFGAYFDNDLFPYSALEVFKARVAGDENAEAINKYYLPLAVYLRAQFFDRGDGLLEEKNASTLQAVIKLLTDLHDRYGQYTGKIEDTLHEILDETLGKDKARKTLNRKAAGIDSTLGNLVQERCEALRGRLEDIFIAFIESEVRLRVDFKAMKDKDALAAKMNDEYGLSDLLSSHIDRTLKRCRTVLEREWEAAISDTVKVAGADPTALGGIQAAMQDAMVRVMVDIGAKLVGILGLFAALMVIPGGQIVDAIAMAIVGALQLFTQGHFIEKIIEKKRQQATKGVKRMAIVKTEEVRDKLLTEVEGWNRNCLDSVLAILTDEKSGIDARKNVLTQLGRQREQDANKVQSYRTVLEDQRGSGSV